MESVCGDITSMAWGTHAPALQLPTKPLAEGQMNCPEAHPLNFYLNCMSKLGQFGFSQIICH